MIQTKRCLATISLLIAAAAQAQPANSTVSEERLRELVGIRVARLGILFTRQTPDPLPADYETAALILGQARLLLPTDEEILRHQIEAWHAAGQDDRVLSATARLLELNPNDTVAQLRIISARISKFQSADDRIAIYDRFLSPAGNSLDPSIRSKLALDAALLAHEKGDETRFIERLTLATQLDITNKQAASLAAIYTLDRIDDPLARLEILMNVIAADPLDASAHLAAGRELLSQGAFIGARWFFARTLDLFYGAGDTPPENLGADYVAIRWGTLGTEGFLDDINEQSKTARETIEHYRAQLREAGEDPTEIPDHEQTIIIERLRLIAAGAASRQEDALDAFKFLGNKTSEARTNFMEQADANPDLAAALVAQLRVVNTEMMWLVLWTGQRHNTAEKIYADIRVHMNDTAQTRFDGWFALRNNELERAEKLLTPIANNDIQSKIGLGMIAELRSDTRTAIRHYAKVALQDPGASPYPSLPFGLWARARIETLLGEPLLQSDVARSLDAYIEALPIELERMTSDPESFVSIRAEQSSALVSPLDTARVRVEIRNVGPTPLSVGPSSPINSSIILAPRTLLSGKIETQGVGPEVISLARRLRLSPGESIVADLWAGAGQTGAFLEQAAASPITQRWRVIQGFRMQEEGSRFIPGHMCVQTESDLQARRALWKPSENPNEISKALHTLTGEHQLEAISYTSWWIRSAINLNALLENATELRNTPGADTDPVTIHRLDTIASIISISLESLDIDSRFDLSSEQKVPAPEHLEAVFTEIFTAFAKSFIERWPHLSPLERAFIGVSIPAGWRATELGPVDELLMAETERVSSVIALLTRATEPDDPFFDRMIAHADTDPDLARLATLLHDRIKRAKDAADAASASP